MVSVPTFFFGQTQSGKSYRAARLWDAHDGPAIYCNIQWLDYFPRGIRARSVKDVVQILSDSKSFSNGPKIDFRLRDYSELDTLVNYALDVHRSRNEAGGAIPTLALFMDEVWRYAGRGADANNAAVRVFTEGLQQKVVGVAMSQWVSQVSRLIPGNSYEFYIYHLWDRDYEILRSIYRMEVPETLWLQNYHYWHYDGNWYRGYPDGREELYGKTELEEPEESVSAETSEKAKTPEEPRTVEGLETWEKPKEKLDSYPDPKNTPP